MPGFHHGVFATHAVTIASTCAVGVMARAPSAAGKTRLAPHLPAPRLQALRAALLADTLLVVAAAPGVDRFIVFTPAAAEREIAALACDAFQLVPQRGTDLGERMQSAFDDLIAGRGYGSAILVGSDIPSLSPAHIPRAQE